MKRRILNIQHKTLPDIFLEGSWEWFLWQRSAYIASIIEVTHWSLHSAEFSRHPYTYFRYVRRHWQKPLFEISAEMMTSSRLISQIWSEISAVHLLNLE